LTRQRLVVAAALVGAVAATWWLGLAGWRYGNVAVPAAFAVAAGAGTWLVLARGSPGRTLWTVSAVILAIVLASVLIDAAPPSRGALVARLDGIRLDFYEVLSERRTGHSWCRPTCPSVTRVYRAPFTSDRANSATVIAGLRAAGLVPAPSRFVMPTRLDFRDRRDGRVLEVRTYRVEDVPAGESPFRLRIRLASA
jgi:hypothetical protein